MTGSRNRRSTSAAAVMSASSRLATALAASAALVEVVRRTPVLAAAATTTYDTPVPTAYVRRTYSIAVPFFTQYWWVGFIIMFVGFLLIVLILYVAVQCHFKESDQRRRRKEIEAGRSDDENLSSTASSGSEDDDDAGSEGTEGRSQGGRASSSANPLRNRH